MNKREVRRMYYLLLHTRIEPALRHCYGKRVYLENNSLYYYSDSFNQRKVIFDFYDIQPVFKFMKACIVKRYRYVTTPSYRIHDKSSVMYIIKYFQDFVYNEYYSKEFDTLSNEHFFTKHHLQYFSQRHHQLIPPIPLSQKTDVMDLLPDRDYQLVESTAFDQGLIALTIMPVILLIILILSMFLYCLCKKLGIDGYRNTGQRQRENYAQEEVSLDEVVHSPIHHRREIRRF